MKDCDWKWCASHWKRREGQELCSRRWWQEEMLRRGTEGTSLTPCQESFLLTHPRGPRPLLLYDPLLEEAIGIVVLGNQK